MGPTRHHRPFPLSFLLRASIIILVSRRNEPATSASVRVGGARKAGRAFRDSPAPRRRTEASRPLRARSRRLRRRLRTPLDLLLRYLHACIKCFLLNAMTFLANLTANSTIRAGCVAWLNLTCACISPAAG
jgi:hypothetical protein